jgi:hypothetical protein
MENRERINAIAECCRHARYPEPLTLAITDYLSGQESLAEVRPAWEMLCEKERQFSYFLDLHYTRESLDVLDLRLLDICTVTLHAGTFFWIIAWQGPVQQARDHLLSQGFSEQEVLISILQGLGWQRRPGYGMSDNAASALGQLFCSYLPHYFEFIKETLEDTQSRAAFLRMLLNTQPPFFELAWQVAQTINEREVAISSILGTCAQRLLACDPDRFTDWARYIAGPTGPADEYSRLVALKALLEQDPARHIDLAVEAVHAPAPTWAYGFEPQMTGLLAVYAFDQTLALPLIEATALGQHYILAQHAIKLLVGNKTEQTRPMLQRCVADGRLLVALTALHCLLEQSWDGQQDYILSLLTHPAKKLRDEASAWLAQQGGAIIDAVAPFLIHQDIGARCSAVQTLLRLESERATVLLDDHLKKETSQQVRKAIIDGIGLPGYRGPHEETRAYTVERLIAKSALCHTYLPRPSLSWFDPNTLPGLRWHNGGAVPLTVLNYLCYRQSRTADPRKLHPEVDQALMLIDCAGAGQLALSLYQGWFSHRPTTQKSWLLPLIAALADDRLAPLMGWQVEVWGTSKQRPLAARLLYCLAQMESQAAHTEIKAVYKRFKRGFLRHVAKEALAKWSGC